MPYHLATRARLEKYARDRVRTCDPLLVLYKTLSTGFEPVTSRLTVAHSNQLSYERNGYGVAQPRIELGTIGV